MDMETLSRPTTELVGFDLFWARYPNKTNRNQARAVWDELEPSAREQEAILGALAIQAGDDFRTMMRGGMVSTPTAAVWLYTRQLRETAPGRACADWRIALETHQPSSPRAALALHAVMWIAIAAGAAVLAGAPALFDDPHGAALADALADAHRVARFEQVSP